MKSHLVVQSKCKTLLFTHSQISNDESGELADVKILQNPEDIRYNQKLIYQKFQQNSLKNTKSIQVTIV